MANDQPALTLTEKPYRLQDGPGSLAEFECSVHGDIGGAVVALTAQVPGGHEFNRVYCLRCMMACLDALPIAQTESELASLGNSVPPAANPS